MIRRVIDFFTQGRSIFAEPLEDAPLALPAPAVEPPPPPPVNEGLPARFDSFDKIYATALSGKNPPPYSILKVAEMLGSSHLAGMSTELKRGSVLMALEAAGVHVSDILQDAMLRQQALEQYEEAQQKKLREFESFKEEANRKLQAELDRITADFMGKIQTNIDEVARQQDAMRAWLKAKHAESALMSSASAYCTQAASVMNGAFSVVIEQQSRR